MVTSLARAFRWQALIAEGVYSNVHELARAIVKDMEEGILILRNSSLKLKTVVENAILLDTAASSENISESIKIKTENGFYLKVNVGIFWWNKKRPEK